VTRARHAIAAIFAVLGAALLGSCEIDKADDACTRLRDYSCNCFPGCQNDDREIMDSQDEGRCEAHLRSRGQYWERCKDRCSVNCEFGWGECAFGYYRQVGLDPQGVCTLDDGGAGEAGADVGAD
jgi:hypothetical protein